MFIVASGAKPAQPRLRQFPKILLPQGVAGNWLTGYTGREFQDPAKPIKDPILPKPDQIFPVAYLVEQDANSSLRSHFHVVDQFQVFVSGSGRLGTVVIDGISIQFVGPHSAYGPIDAGPNGIDYMVLRNRYDPGSRVLPESRSELPPPPRTFRQLLGGPVQLLAPDALAALNEVTSAELIAKESDGLEAWHYQVPAGESVVGPDPASGDGQHWLVLRGDLDCGTELVGRNSCLFLSSDEAAFSAKAGPAGLEVLALQYPRRSKH